MGLDIHAYRNAVKLDTKFFDEDGDPVDSNGDAIEYDTRIYANPDFPGRETGVDHRAFYKAEHGSHARWGYGRYNVLRNELAKLAGYPVGEYERYGTKYQSYCVACWNGEQGPFAELINFSDCEGTIGPVVAKKLAADFAEYQSKADAHESEQFRSFYAALSEAFTLAAEDGFVVFT